MWRTRAAEGATTLVGIVLIGLFLAGFVERNLIHQGDLKTYLLAAKAVREGLDPYRPEDLNALAGRRVLPFVYPPITLPGFVALSSLPAKTVAAVWLWGKIAMLAALVLAWRRWLVPRAGLLPLALVACFGWNSSAQWDLASGNVAILECALLYAAFACVVSGRRLAFAALVVAAACFKLQPAVFLLLLLVPTNGGPARPRTFVAAALLLAGLVLGPVWVGPAAHWQHFWTTVPDASAYGNANPSGLGLATALVGRLGFDGTLATRLAEAAWCVASLGLLAVSLPHLRQAWGAGDARRWIMSAVFLFVLLSPRPMAYGFVLLIPAPFYFAPSPFDRPAGRWLLALVLSAQGLSRAAYVQSASPLFVYAPFLLTLCVWLLVVRGEPGRARDALRARMGSPEAAATDTLGRDQLQPSRTARA